MDWCLIGMALFGWSMAWIVDPITWLVILIVALGLGTVIFVHELGHFVVAKLCGVKCEKFYLGFDIGGWKICKFKWGETEYGIGVLPLGGYVKMLGQEDNPSRLKEEIERAKAAEALGLDPSARKPEDSNEPPIDLEEAKAALYDPRSYLAKSVPKRMAIISAGVIMNMIFGFIVAVVAYLIGINQMVCEVGSVQPGDPAWEANIQPGDRMVEVNGKPTYCFDDLFARIPLSSEEDGVSMVIERPGLSEPINLILHPNRDRLLPAVGVGPAHTTTLQKPSAWLGGNDLKPYWPCTPVAQAEPPFALGDKIIAIDGVPVKTGPELDDALSSRRNQPVEVTVERATKKGQTPEQLTIKVNPKPMKRLGLIMKMGQIMAVQEGSSAEVADIKPDDVLVAINGEPVGDPMTLPDRLWALVNKAVEDTGSAPTVTLTLKRKVEVKSESGKKPKSEEQTIDVPVTLRQTNTYYSLSPLFHNGLIGVPSLGIAYRVNNEVTAVIPDSPAAKAGVAPGDVLTQAILTPPSNEDLEQLGADPSNHSKSDFDFKKYPYDWPRLFDFNLQGLIPGSKVELVFKGGKKVELEPVEVDDWFNPKRGFLIETKQYTRRANSLGEAIQLGGAKTLELTLLQLKTIKMLITGKLSPKLLGGPIMIAKVAGAKASRGLSDFLFFLTMISVMLAVVNFLPIPVLDGGHFVFLIYEGIRGKPVDERVQIALSYAGLLLILALMVWAIGLDTSLIPRE